jgi:hypothetical protein
LCSRATSAGNRILTAGDLVRQGLAPKALISGPSEIYGQFESDLAIPFAVRRGYPASDFVALHGEGIFQYWMRVILIGISRDIEYDLRNDLFRAW